MIENFYFLNKSSLALKRQNEAAESCTKDGESPVVNNSLFK
jgi:hypothetical protein